MSTTISQFFQVTSTAPAEAKAGSLPAESGGDFHSHLASANESIAKPEEKTSSPATERVDDQQPLESHNEDSDSPNEKDSTTSADTDTSYDQSVEVEQATVDQTEIATSDELELSAEIVSLLTTPTQELSPELVDLSQETIVETSVSGSLLVEAVPGHPQELPFHFEVQASEVASQPIAEAPPVVDATAQPLSEIPTEVPEQEAETAVEVDQVVAKVESEATVPNEANRQIKSDHASLADEPENATSTITTPSNTGSLAENSEGDHLEANFLEEVQEESNSESSQGEQEQLARQDVVKVPETQVATEQESPELEASTEDVEPPKPLEAKAANAETKTDVQQEKPTPDARQADPTANTEPEPVPTQNRVRFVQRVTRAFQSARAGGGEIQLKLSPPELGSMRLSISVEQGVVSAKVETETAAARNILLDNLPALRERLAEQDIRVEKFDVDVGRDGQQSDPQDNLGARDRQRSDSAENRGRSSSLESSDAEESSDPAPTQRQQFVSDKSLDVSV